MKRYKIKISKKYVFNLSGEDREEINKQVNTIMNESNILDLPYVKKYIKVKIKRIRQLYISQVFFTNFMKKFENSKLLKITHD